METDIQFDTSQQTMGTKCLDWVATLVEGRVHPYQMGFRMAGQASRVTTARKAWVRMDTAIKEAIL